MGGKEENMKEGTEESRRLINEVARLISNWTLYGGYCQDDVKAEDITDECASLAIHLISVVEDFLPEGQTNQEKEN